MATKAAAQQYKVTANISRTYGRVTATFGAELIVDVETNNTPNQAYALLMDIINDQFHHYESAVLHTTPAEPTIYDQKGAGARPEIVDCRLLVVALDKGKVSYRIKGGRFEKFGVSIYPEVLSLYKDLDTLQVNTSYPMPGWKMAVDTSKAAKVVQLIAPA